MFEALPARRWRTGGEIALTAGVPSVAPLAELTALESAGLVDGAVEGWRLRARPDNARSSPGEGVEPQVPVITKGGKRYSYDLSM